MTRFRNAFVVLGSGCVVLLGNGCDRHDPNELTLSGRAQVVGSELVDSDTARFSLGGATTNISLESPELACGEKLPVVVAPIQPERGPLADAQRLEIRDEVPVDRHDVSRSVGNWQPPRDTAHEAKLREYGEALQTRAEDLARMSEQDAEATRANLKAAIMPVERLVAEVLR